MELLNHRDVKRLILRNGLVEGVREPLLEVLLAAEDLGHQEMHEGPQLHDIILQGGTSEQESPFGVEPEQGLPPLAFEVLDVLGLVQDHIVPFLPPEGKVVLNYELVRGDAHMEGVVLAPAVSLDLSLFLGSEIGQDL